MILRGCDPLDMEQYGNKVTNIIHDVRYNRYNTINLRIYLNRQHSDWNVAAESYISYGV